jgi:cytochrome P450
MGAGIGLELPLVAWLGRRIPLSFFRTMFRAQDYLFQYAQRAVKSSRMTSDSSRSIFSGMLNESEKGDGAITDVDVVLEAGGLILAGSDTTAVTLTYLIWAVLSQPKLQRELEEEVNTLGADFNDASLEKLPLLNAVIMETLRLYGAAPGALPRATPEDGAVFAGYFVPEGVTVSTQSYSIHRDQDSYLDPERFDVSRWLTTPTSASELAKKAFLPFGAGPRICLGIHLAWMELRLTTAEFFRECRSVRLAPSATWENMKPVNYILIAPRGHRCEIIAK